jgi:hypothetical protein
LPGGVIEAVPRCRIARFYPRYQRISACIRVPAFLFGWLGQIPVDETYK